MVTSFEKAMSPLFTLSRVFGLRVLEYPPGRRRPYVTLVYVCILLTVYAGALYHVVTILSPFIDDITVFIFPILIYTSNMMTLLVSMILSVYYRKRYARCMKRIVIVDDVLESLGVPKEYSELHNVVWKMLLTYSSIVLFLNVSDVVWCYASGYSYYALVVFNTINYPVHINTILDLNVWIVLRRLHLEVCFISQEINSLFGVQSVLEIGSYFALLTGFCVTGYNEIGATSNDTGRTTKVAVLSFWALVFILKVFNVNHLCETVSSKANSTKLILDEVISFIEDAETRKDIKQFIFRILQKPLRFTGLGFTGLGFHYYGYQFMWKFFGSIITFLIIMIQLKAGNGPL